MPTPKLSSPDTLVIFTTAPAGLGHLRVTQALLDGLPQDCHSFILGLHDKTISSIHRKLSNNRFLFNTQLFVQHNPVAEKMFTKIYQDNLRRQSQDVYNQLFTIITSHQPKLNQVYIVATHFGLAHQIAQIKQELIGQTGINISLHVIVTDDTFQPIWAVKGADRITIPSRKMEEKYREYMQNRYSIPTEIKFIPYPVSPRMGANKTEIITQKKKQLELKGQTRIMIPVSGAATQLDFLLLITHHLVKSQSNFLINIVTVNNPLTKSFANIIKHLPQTRVHLCDGNQQTLEKYLQIYSESDPITLEITKPSEQTYKALFTPKQIGGAILLLSHPIGKQEEDNLEFLRRNLLIPNEKQQKFLNNIAGLNSTQISSLKKEAKKWRALVLPDHSYQSARYIIDLKKYGLFQAMLAYKHSNKPEVSDNGVRMFWESID